MNFDQERKFDGDKLSWDLLPIEPIERVVEILTYGAKKYAPESWQSVRPFSRRYYAAAMRHLSAWRQGEIVDEESGLDHLAHAACNLLFLMWGDDNLGNRKGDLFEDE